MSTPPTSAPHRELAAAPCTASMDPSVDAAAVASASIASGAAMTVAKHATWTDADRPRRERGALLRSLSGQLGSQALLAAVGVAALPLLARNLGTERYGHFSLALAVLGLSSGLDLVRPRFVRGFARGDVDAREFASVWTIDILLVTGVATLLALVGLGAAAALPIGVGALAFAVASREFSWLAGNGRVGTVTAVRNLAWAAATVGAVVVSAVHPGGWAWLWCFPAVSAACLVAYRILARGADRAALPAPGWDVAAWRRARPDVRDLLGHGLAVLVLGSADKLLLERGGHEGAGAYMGQYDLAVKVHVISTALGAALYPIWSRSVRDGGIDAAARGFRRFASRASFAYFAVLALGVWFHQPIVRGVLGADFAPAAPLFAWMLPGVFLAHHGFLYTPWQRARGDFAGQRRAYATAAVVMVVVGALTIPRFGPAGAVATYLAARAADVLLLVGERRSGGDAAPLVRAAALSAALFALAWYATGGTA